MPVTPSPKRRAHMLQAHALRARGFSIAQIARATDHAPSTVHAWLRDFEFEREHIVAAIAQDQLLVLLHSQAELLRLNELDPPKSADHADSRHRQLQALAALTRELRLVCAVLLRAKHDHAFKYEQPQDLDLPAQEFDAVAPVAQLQTLLADLLAPPTEAAEAAKPDEQTESQRTEPNPPRRSERNLEVSERSQPRSPVHNGKSSKPTRKNTAPTPVPAPARGPVPAPLRIPRNTGRNQPCPCGSGRKRKRCHPNGLPNSGLDRGPSR